MSDFNTNKTLIDAFRNNDLTGVATALENGADPTISKNPNSSKSLLVEAIELGRDKIAGLLINATPDVNALYIPWKMAAEKGLSTFFQAFCEKNTALLNPDRFSEHDITDNVWFQMALHFSHPKSRPAFHALIALSARLGYRFPPGLSNIMGQEVGGWPDAAPSLEALTALVDDEKQFFENVALGSCIKATQGAKMELYTRKTRAWAMKKGASFMVQRTYNDQMACQVLLRLPPRSEGGFKAWIDLWGSRLSSMMIEKLIRDTLKYPSAEVFSLLWKYRDKTMPWSTSKFKDKVLKHSPLPHTMVTQLFSFNENRQTQKGCRLLKAIVATGHELHALNDEGQTALHVAIIRHEYSSKGTLHAKTLSRIIKIFHNAGLTLSVKNKAGEMVVGMVKRMGDPEKMALVSQWEKVQLENILTQPLIERSTRKRI